MIFIRLDENGEISATHYFPFHPQHGMGKTVEELESEGVLVEDIPSPKIIENKCSVLKYNSVTKSLYYEYIDIPKIQETIDERVSALEIAMANTMGV